MILSIEHHTRYVYSEPVTYTIQQLRLMPQNGFGQHVRRWEIHVNGELPRSVDAYGNLVHTLVVDVPHQEIVIVAMGEVETGLNQNQQAFLSQQQSLPMAVYLRDTALTQRNQELIDFASQFRQSENQIRALEDMMQAIRTRVAYTKGVTQVTTTAAEAFSLGQGVCQDHAHIFIACCRAIGLPARYVSGYLFTEDASLMQTHAWAEVYLQNEGWQSFDISNGCRVDALHVRLASGLDYRSASPVSGTRSGGGTEAMVSSVIVNQAGSPMNKQHKMTARHLMKQAQLSREEIIQAALLKQVEQSQQ